MAGKWSKIAGYVGKGVIWGLTFILDHPEIIGIVLDSAEKAKSKQK